MLSALFLPAAVINLASSTAMALRVAMLLMALLAASSAYSPVGVSLVSRSRVLPARPHGCVLLLHASALTAPGSLHCQRHALKDTTSGSGASGSLKSPDANPASRRVPLECRVFTHLECRV